ncbi:MAG: flagellar basal body-associated FliL family protein [Lachnospiraceae bacterium]|nr:flagellar basal body-associated FliL family protein [Lachnospiraceae bacterium]
MKKNLITVLIFALCLINLVFNILLVFVFMPSATKTNKLITEIAAVLDLELASQKNDNEFDVSNIEVFQLEQGNPINLAQDSSGEIHMVQYGISINLDTTSSDYSKVLANMQKSTSLIYDITNDIIGKYSYNQVIDVSVKKQIKEEIQKSLKEAFNTECIHSISFYNWVAN